MEKETQWKQYQDGKKSKGKSLVCQIAKNVRKKKERKISQLIL